MKPVDVVGLGYNSVDLICAVPTFPEPNSKNPALSFEKQGGGQVATALVALARWGVQCAYIGKVGDDENGEFVRDQLNREGVDTSALVVKKGGTSQFAVIIAPQDDGERTILWRRDPKSNLFSKDIKKRDVLRGRILHLDGHEIEAALSAARWAKKAGRLVVFDGEKVFSGTEELIKLTDYLITSEEFPFKYTGKKDKRRALKELKKLCPGLVAMTLGKEGALAYDGHRFIHSRGIPVVAVDTTGAGDVFHGGFIFGLLRGWPIEKVLDFANKAAALKCRFPGGRKGIPSLKEIAAIR